MSSTQWIMFLQNTGKDVNFSRAKFLRVWLPFEMNEGTYKEKACQQIFLQKLRSGSHHSTLTLFSRVHGRNLRLGGWISLEQVEESGLSKGSRVAIRKKVEWEQLYPSQDLQRLVSWELKEQGRHV